MVERMLLVLISSDANARLQNTRPNPWSHISKLVNLSGDSGESIIELKVVVMNLE